MPYVLKSKGRFFLEGSPSVWVDYIEWATIYRDCDEDYAEEVAQEYRDEGREVDVKHIIMEEK